MSTTIPAAVEAALATGSIDDVLAATIAHFGCQAGTVHLMRDGALRLAASSGIPPHVAQIVETVPVGKGIAGLAAERREPITICNLQSDTSGQARPGARATGMEGSIAVPMLLAGEVRGVVGVAKAAAYDWSEAESGLLSLIAGRLGAR
jgi:signal transduction protein with GAF and PtsI domain